MPAGYGQLLEHARGVVAEAIAFAEASPLPDPRSAASGVMSLPFDARGPS